MSQLRFTGVTLTLCISSVLVVGAPGHLQAKMMSAVSAPDSFVQSSVSGSADDTSLQRSKAAPRPNDVGSPTPHSSHHPSTEKPGHPSTNRHHHHNPISGDPMPQVAAHVPDTGTCMVLLAIALGSLAAARFVSRFGRLNA